MRRARGRGDAIARVVVILAHNLCKVSGNVHWAGREHSFRRPHSQHFLDASGRLWRLRIGRARPGHAERLRLIRL